MQTGRRLALALGCASLGLYLGAAAAAVPGGSAYVWAQPGAAVKGCSFAQPPAWIRIVPKTVTAPIPGSGYLWAQPGCAPVHVPFAQPWG